MRDATKRGAVAIVVRDRRVRTACVRWLTESRARLQAIAAAVGGRPWSPEAMKRGA